MSRISHSNSVFKCGGRTGTGILVTRGSCNLVARPQLISKIPNLIEFGRETGQCDYHPRRAVPIKPISSLALPKKEILQWLSGDGPPISEDSGSNPVSVETPHARKTRNWRAFHALKKEILRKPHWLAGDAVLIAPVSVPNSLLTGNFTGKIAQMEARTEPISGETTYNVRIFRRMP